MTQSTREKIEAMDGILVDTVKVTTIQNNFPQIDEYEDARAEVHEGILIVRYSTGAVYYSKMYAQGIWTEVVSSLSKARLIESLDRTSGLAQ